MNTVLRAINAFIEDTSVLLVFAYLLARGRILELLFRERLTGWQAVSLGCVLGILGLTETTFPGARFPYTTHTLIVTFATIAGRLPVGLITAAVVTAGAFLLRTMPAAVTTALAVLTCALVAELVRRAVGDRHRLLGGFAAGLLTQSATLVVWADAAGRLHASVPFSHALITVPANGFGVILLMLVVSDARIRADSERNRAEAQRAQALVAEAQLNALRARVHPHFLFNTLTSIAGLCSVAPERAEVAIVRLGQLMRRLLEYKPTKAVLLSEEIAHVQSYLEIEQLRLGHRLSVTWKIDSRCESVLVPPFAVQTLVENAIQHGIVPKLGPGAILIAARRYPRHALVAVRDDGAGMTDDLRRSALSPAASRVHGLLILTQQLSLLYNARARLRLFSRAEAGTLAVFVVPIGVGPPY